MVQSFREMIGIQPSTATTSDSVLVIIDAQNEYINGKLATANISNTRKAISTLLEKYRAANGSIVHIVHQTPEGAPVFTPGTALAAEFDELTPKNGEVVISKQHPGSFAGTTLEEEIKKSGKSKLVLVGYMAHVCVSTTTRQAAQRGYNVVIPGDAVGDRDIPSVDGSVVKGEEVTRVVLSELADGFATVVKVADIN